MTDNVNDFLAHFGVKGMHWGVRTSRGGYIGKESKAKAKAKEEPSEDHKTVSSLRKKSLPSLSNEDLQKVNTRLQLEKSYKELTQSKSTLDKGQKKVNRVLGLANTAQQVYNLYNSPMVKAVKKAFPKS